jgi:hypothetical protein
MALGIDIKTIQGATPDSFKKQGIARISDLLIKKGEEIKTQIEPKLIQELEKAKDGSACGDQDKLKKLLNTRNNIVSKLNTISKVLDTSIAAFAGIGTLLSLVLILKQALTITKTAANIGAAFLPAVPGGVVSSINVVGDAIDATTFNNKGVSRLEKLEIILAGSTIAVTILSAIIKTVILLLNQLDTELGKCANLNIVGTLTPVDANLITIANTTLEAEDTLNNTTYNGFIITVETIPFTDTVNQFRAIGTNSDGIKLIETPLSFTTNKQTLIDELKFIIDRDNLKAN